MPFVLFDSAFWRARPRYLACRVLLPCGLALLAACSEAPGPQADAGPAAPILQNQELRFPPKHPQLALLASQPAVAAQDLAVDLPARLVWNEERTQRIAPPFAGRVTAIQADLGQSVKAGAVLAQMASPDFGQAQADTARAQADAALASKALSRQRELFAAGIVARKELEQVEAEAARAQAEVARAAARTRLYGGGTRVDQVDQALSLRAGLSGVVVERNLTPGQELRPDQAGPGVPPLFVISDPSTLWVQIDVREADVAALSPGSSFQLRVPAYPDQVFAGKVLALSDAIDPQSRTLKARGQVANADRRLKAEMLGTARIQKSLGEGVVIPAKAVTLEGGRHRVFVQVQPGVFAPREVVLAHEGSKDVVVRQGLQAGESVVVENTLLLARQFRLAQDEAREGAR